MNWPVGWLHLSTRERKWEMRERERERESRLSHDSNPCGSAV